MSLALVELLYTFTLHTHALNTFITQNGVDLLDVYLTKYSIAASIKGFMYMYLVHIHVHFICTIHYTVH